MGLWSTEFAQLNQVVHLWAYPGLDARADVRRRALQDPVWQAFVAASAALLVQQESVVLLPTLHSPMQ